MFCPLQVVCTVTVPASKCSLRGAITIFWSSLPQTLIAPGRYREKSIQFIHLFIRYLCFCVAGTGNMVTNKTKVPRDQKHITSGTNNCYTWKQRRGVQEDWGKPCKEISHKVRSSVSQDDGTVGMKVLKEKPTLMGHIHHWRVVTSLPKQIQPSVSGLAGHREDLDFTRGQKAIRGLWMLLWSDLGHWEWNGLCVSQYWRANNTATNSTNSNFE